jgi:hypothetical protein
MTYTTIYQRIEFSWIGRLFKKIKHFGIISTPLTNLLKKNIIFIWTPDLDIAFQTLKLAFMEASVLALPNFGKPFYGLVLKKS